MRPCQVKTTVYVTQAEAPFRKSETIYKRAVFHQWGTTVVEEGDTVAGETVAIVEFEDGKCDTVHPQLIQFTDKQQQALKGE